MPIQQTRPQKSKRLRSLFAPGQICYPDEVQQVLARAGVQGVTLICRHITGQWGDIDPRRQRLNRWALTQPQAEPRLPIISRYSLPGGRQVMLITYHARSSARRRTQLVLWPPALKTSLEEELQPGPAVPGAGPPHRRKEAPRVEL